MLNLCAINLDNYIEIETHSLTFKTLKIWPLDTHLFHFPNTTDMRFQHFKRRGTWSWKIV